LKSNRSDGQKGRELGGGIFARPRFPIPIFFPLQNFVSVELARRLLFVLANGLGGVFITEKGGWHALSNREQVA
jgi:hypothetical protein